MNVLYKADIPDGYCYVQFTNTGYKLFANNEPQIGDDFYEFFTNVGSDIYIHSYVTNEDIMQGEVNTSQIHYHDVSSDVMYRSDIHSIYNTTFILGLCFIFLINIVTRVIRKGGIFSL